MTDPNVPAAVTGLEVAIIGMAVRVPGASDVETFWANLRDGVESIRRFDPEELAANGVTPDQIANPNYVRAGAVLDDIDRFDASFFGYPPREAEVIDPQHRLFLECAWQALEAAGHDPARCRERIGVYAGSGLSSYLLRNLGSRSGGIASRIHKMLGNDKDHLATRVSYKLDLKGPGVTVQTACSTSLVAVHLACQGLLAGECEMALAGGVSITLPHRVGYLYEEQGIYSPDGHCRAFDAAADGTVGGSGVAIVVLKSLEAALADGDHVHAVILGSAINNDGSAKVGYTAPSVEGQSRVIRQALAAAGIEAGAVGYVETHGTGTRLGDPIEMAALMKAFRGAGAKGSVAVGSLKTNVGHLDCAAGAASLIKAALAVEHGQLPPSLNYEEPNPEIDFAGGPFFVNERPRDWPEKDGPRTAGVSSFGMGGTNAHVIVQQAPAPAASGPGRPQEVLVLSARTPAALETMSDNLADHLERSPGLLLADVAHTLQVGRHQFAHRRTLLCDSPADAVTALKARDPKKVATELHEPGRRPVVFLFPGQGAQYVDMGRGLLETESVFRRALDECADLLQPQVGWDLRDALFPGGDPAEAAERLTRTEVTQPALFAVEYALARLWMSWGVQPDAMIGHSIGEYVAACLAGVFTLPEGVALVAERGRLMQSLPEGEMTAVGLPAEEVAGFLPDGVSIATINEASRCVVSGRTEAIEPFEAELGRRGVTSQRLHTSHAFHSEMMEPILEPFRERVARVELKAPGIPFVSNLTGTWIEPDQATDPDYWARHLRHAVQFEKGMGRLLEQRRAVFLEVGPGRTLSTFTGRHPDREPEHAVVTSMRHPRDGQPDLGFLMSSLGQMWRSGVEIDWSGFRAKERRRRVALPAYPFERKRYWIEAGDDDEAPRGKPGKIADVSQWFWVEGWRSTPAAPPADEGTGDGRPWLVLAGESDDPVVQRIRTRHDVTLVRSGDGWSALDETTYSVAPGAPEEYRALVAALRERDRLPGTIVHLWGAGAAPPDPDAELDRCFHGLVHLLQALDEADADHPLRVLVVTRGAVEVTGEEDLYPIRAAAVGLGKVIPQELPHTSCRCVDIAGDAGENVERIVAELEASPGEPLVALRGSRRWVPVYDRVVLAPGSGCPARLREGGVYVITGGTGAVGLEAAGVLARTARAKLVLVARGEVPPRQEWDRILAEEDPASERARRVRKLREIENHGAELLTISADVTDRSAMESALERARARFGRIHGVIHAAGAVQDMHPVRLASRRDNTAQFEPKLRGVSVLAEVLSGTDLDFCLVFSSLSSVLGAVGFGAYTAAHTFLDAFAAKQSRLSAFPWVTVNWDNWYTWRTGDAAGDGGNEYFMTAEEGATALATALSHTGDRRLILSTGDLRHRIDEWVRPASGSEPDGGDGDSLYERPALQTEYAEPTSDVERTLASVWNKELGIDGVGVHDNYFELGGDSVIAIQVVSEAVKLGLRLTPADIFANPTISELATVAQGAGGALADQGPVTGPVPLTPIQHWFFERDLPNPHHFNLPVLLRVDDRLDEAGLREALQILVGHHDALRLRYRTANGSLEQEAPAPGDSVSVERIDLSSEVNEKLDSAVGRHAAIAQQSLELETGPPVRAVLFDCGSGRANRVLLIVHHLVVDVVSWRILVEDFELVQEARIAGRDATLPQKTTSYRSWAEQLVEYANSESVAAEREYWESVAGPAPLPLPTDFEAPEGANRESSAQTVRAALAEDETGALVAGLRSLDRATINDALLTAMSRAFCAWTGHRSLLVDLEMHGREPIADGLDLSRTVGWFTSIFPVRLDAGEAAEAGTALQRVRAQVGGIPRRGIGYGALRYLHADRELRSGLAFAPGAEVAFLYLGRTRSDAGVASSFWDACDLGPAVDPDQPRSHSIQVVAQVREGRLSTEWIFSGDLHRRATIETLAEGFLDELRAITAYAEAAEPAAPAPSDFPAARIGQRDLDTLLTKLRGTGKNPKDPPG